MKKYFFVILVVFFSFSLFAQSGLSEDQERRIQELENIVKEQEKRINELQDQVGANQESTKEYTEKIVREYLNKSDVQEDEGGVTAGYDRGFFIRSADGNFEMVFTGVVQAGVGIFENDTFDKFV